MPYPRTVAPGITLGPRPAKPYRFVYNPLSSCGVRYVMKYNRDGLLAGGPPADNISPALPIDFRGSHAEGTTGFGCRAAGIRRDERGLRRLRPRCKRDPSKEGLDFFEKHIRPVLVHNCYECHSGEPPKPRGTCCSTPPKVAQRGRLRGGDPARPRRLEPIGRSDSLRRARDAPQGTIARRS